MDNTTWKALLPLDAPPAVLEKMLKRLEGREEAVAEVRGSEPVPEQKINVDLTEQLHTCPRYGSKVGLWLGSHVYGDAWLDTEVADASRKILWDDSREVQQASALPSHGCVGL